MKILLRLLLVLVVLLVAAAAVAWFQLDRIVVESVERGGTYALGVETELEGAEIDLGGTTSLGLHGLAVANPPGFQTPRFLGVGSTSVTVEAGTLTEDVVVVPEIEVRDVDVALERREGRTNYGVILEHLERLESGEQPPAEEEPPSGKKLAIGRIRIVGVSATIDLLPVGGQLSRFSVQVPEVLLEDVEDGISVSQVVALVVKTLLTTTINEGSGILPPGALEDLQAELAGLKEVAFEIQGEVTKQAEAAVQEGLERAREALEEELGGEAGRVLEGLGGVLGGKKKEPPPPPPAPPPDGGGE